MLAITKLSKQNKLVALSACSGYMLIRHDYFTLRLALVFK